MQGKREYVKFAYHPTQVKAKPQKGVARAGCAQVRPAHGRCSQRMGTGREPDNTIPGFDGSKHGKPMNQSRVRM